MFYNFTEKIFVERKGIFADCGNPPAGFVRNSDGSFSSFEYSRRVSISQLSLLQSVFSEKFVIVFNKYG